MSTVSECGRSLTDFQGSDYLRYPLPHSERTKHLESWLREALILPFEYHAAIDKNDQFVSFGQSLVEINEHALKVREGQVGEARVKAEMEGIVRLETLLRQAHKGDLLFLFSPPGLTEEGFGKDDQRRLSFTYIFEVGESKGSDKKSVRAIAIPTLEISPQLQVKQFSDIFTEANSVALTSTSDEPIDRRIVATPVLVIGLSDEVRNEKLDKYIKAFKGISYAELEQSIDQGLQLQNDEHSQNRRKALIESISWQIRRYVDEQDGPRLNNIGEAARVVMAREASGHYIGMTPDLLLQEYVKTEGAMWLQLQYQVASKNERDQLLDKYGAQLAISEMHLRSVREALLADPGATDMLMGSACGGGGLGDALSGMSGKFGQMLTGRGNLLEKQMEAIKDNNNESSGSEDMKCVTCPFCSELVDAIVTSDKIECPKCHNSASRG